MKILNILLICWAVILTSAKEYKLYYLGGQSNMDGLGSIQDLPSELSKPLPGIYIPGGVRRVQIIKNHRRRQRHGA